jgi:hypothetical protein
LEAIMRRILMLFLIAAAAACSGEVGQADPQQEAANAATNTPATAQDAQQRILALPEPQRLAVFANAIRDAGQDCQQVNSAAGAGTYRGNPVWHASCRGGGQWTVVIGDNGIASVLNEAEARLITDQDANASANAQ